jgi:hypothetical protein
MRINQNLEQNECKAKTGIFVILTVIAAWFPPAVMADPVGGSVSGVGGQKTITCTNLTSRQKITFRTKSQSWNCEEHGLVANQGEKVEEKVVGLVSVAASLSGLRWELPCLFPSGDPRVCETNSSFAAATSMGGPSGTQYDVTLRFRGVIETKHYSGGITDGFWSAGGTPDSDGWNTYKLVISSPAQTYYINYGDSGLNYCFPMDYTKTIRVAAGASVTLTALSVDQLEIKNVDQAGNPIVVRGVPPAPNPYDGQFVQMDVVSVVLAP